MDPRDATRPCLQNRPGCARRDGSRMRARLLSTRIHAPPAQASSSRALDAVTRLRWGHECSAARRDTTHSGHACRPSRPNFRRARLLLLPDRVERLPIDTGKEPFARTGGTSEPSHKRVVHVLSCWGVCCVLLSMFAAISIALSTTVHLSSVSAAHRASSPSSYLACLPSFLKRWQHSVIASR